MALQVLEFDLLISSLPRMARLCVGVYERKLHHHRGNALHPLFWVNASAFDYRGRLRRKGTHHMWSYSAAGDCAPTHANLSPLRQTMGNPNLEVPFPRWIQGAKTTIPCVFQRARPIWC